MDDTQSPPTLIPNEPQYNYIKRIKEYNIKLNESNYNIIFNILKQYLKLDEKKYISLYDIKNIKGSYFLNTEYNKEFFTTNKKTIVDILKIKYDLKKFDDKEIKRFIRRMLKVIKYSLLLKKINDTYYIRKKNNP